MKLPVSSVPEISEHLNQLLNQWTARGTALRKEIGFQRDILSSYSLALDGSRMALRESRRRNLEAFKEKQAQADIRWNERIHRIEEWQKDVARHQTQEDQLSYVAKTVHWLRKVELAAEPFTRWLDHRSEWLHVQHTAFHTDLLQWQSVLVERYTQLRGLKEKEDQMPHRLLVSRARRQMEIDFVQENKQTQAQLDEQLRGLRFVLNHALGRIQKACTALEHRTTPSAASLAVYQRNLINSLNPPRQRLYERREDVFSDALLFESAKRQFRMIQDFVNTLRCVEDVYGKKSSGWGKLFSH